MNREEKGQTRHGIFVRSGGHCEDCGKRICEQVGLWGSMHLSHTKSRGAGGTWEATNLKALCIWCHMVGIHNPKSVPRVDGTHKAQDQEA